MGALGTNSIKYPETIKKLRLSIPCPMKAKQNPPRIVKTKLRFTLIHMIIVSLIPTISFGQEEGNDSYYEENSSNSSSIFNDSDTLHLLSLSFDVAISERDALIEWSTFLDINQYHFTIEHSLDCIGWEAIHQIESVESNNGQCLYSWTDSEPHKNISYYRLKIADAEGYIHYSPIECFNFNEVVEASKLLVYPNPVISNLTIEGSANELEELTILNEFGEDVSSTVQFFVTNTDIINIDVSALPAGNFHLRTPTNLVRVSKIE